MKIKTYVFVIFGLIVTNPIICQDFNPTGLNKNQLTKKPAFSLEDYKKQCEFISDTIWLPTRQDTYIWNGVELEMTQFYYLLSYTSPYELSTLIEMDSSTNDTVQMVQYDYDEQLRKISEVYMIYDQENEQWKIDYKALISYDEFSCVNKTMVQAWNKETFTWHDSIAEIIINVDTNEVIEHYIEKYINNEWVKLSGYQWIYHYTPEQYVYEQINYEWDTQLEQYVYKVRAEYSLNEDGSWYDAIWYKWEQDWVQFQRYSDVTWALFNKYPNNYKNKPTHALLSWWVGSYWYSYLQHDYEYPSPKLDDITRHLYSWDNSSAQWYLSNYYTSRHYQYGWKRRYTEYLRSSINEEMKLNYDDSCRWYFFKGAFEEMVRVSYDTTSNEWTPAARWVYSGFVPFVEIMAGIDYVKKPVEKLKIIPNPTNKLMEIENNQQISELYLYDSKGNCVLNLKGQTDNPKISINVSRFTQGIYFVRAISEKNGIISGKVIVN